MIRAVQHLVRLAIALPLLASCSPSIQPSTHSAENCTVQKYKEIPLRLEQGFLIVDAEFGGHPITLLVDTGAQSTTVTPSFVSQLGLQENSDKTQILATGGTFMSRNVTVPSGNIAGISIASGSVPVSMMPVSASPSPPSGILGADWLSNYDIEFDIANLRMTLFNVANCVGDYIPWTGPKATPITRVVRKQVLFQVEIDGHPMTALFDTGANRSVLSDRAAAGAGLPPLRDAKDRLGSAFGADGNRRITRHHVFDQFRIGTLRIRGAPFQVQALQISTVSMLLGADFLTAHRVWVSFANSKLAVQLSRSE